MPLSPQRHRPTGNPNLANADQNLTEVDARLTKVDTVNPSDAPRTNLNNPEQIRTNPNTAERPDQIGAPPESPPNTRKKTKPEHRRRPPRDFARQQSGCPPASSAARAKMPASICSLSSPVNVLRWLGW